MNPRGSFLSERQTRLGGYGSSSIGRVAVSKTVGWGFKSLLPCQPERMDGWMNGLLDNWVGGTDD